MSFLFFFLITDNYSVENRLTSLIQKHRVLQHEELHNVKSRLTQVLKRSFISIISRASVFPFSRHMSILDFLLLHQTYFSQ